jgi:hypothetical protein
MSLVCGRRGRVLVWAEQAFAQFSRRLPRASQRHHGEHRCWPVGTCSPCECVPERRCGEPSSLALPSRAAMGGIDPNAGAQSGVSSHEQFDEIDWHRRPRVRRTLRGRVWGSPCSALLCAGGVQVVARLAEQRADVRPPFAEAYSFMPQGVTPALFAIPFTSDIGPRARQVVRFRMRSGMTSRISP